MFLKRLMVFCMVLFFACSGKGQTPQTFAGDTGLIPDDQAWHMYPIAVSGLHHSPIDTIWGLEKVTLDITHTWDSDLEVWLQSPDSTQILLYSSIGGDGDNFTSTALSNNFATPIATGGAPFTGNFKPMGDMGAFNNYQLGNGTWYLKIRDNAAQDEGFLHAWSLRFSSTPSVPYPPISSNLPIIKINTHGQNIPDNPKIAADFMIIDNGPGNRNYSNDTVYAYHGNSGFELRGSSSQAAPKLSYGFETWDTLNTAIDTSLLGMPSQSDWILSASYYDKTLMRNVLSYHLANQTGQYAPRTRYCELFINGQYEGVFVLMEKIKKDKNRVNISKMTSADTTGDALTGGYILKIDKFTGSGGQGFYSRYSPSNPSGDTIYIQYDYPKGIDIQPAQANYIQKYIDSFETALFGPDFQDPVNGFRRFASEKALIDYLFINEMSKNVDGYRLSTFFYKDKQSKGGKLKLGPVWDYDIAWFNANYCAADDATGWAYNVSYVCAGAAVPAWWERLRQDSLFNQHIYCRWNYLRSNVLSFDSVFSYIDSTVSYINEGQQRNFTTWAELGVATWPEPGPIPQTYPEEIQRLKDWINTRFTWLDSQFDSLVHNPVPVYLRNDTTVCEGTQLQLYAGDFDTYLWSNGDTNAVTYVGSSGNYAVTVNDKFQCVGNDAVAITVQLAPLSTISILGITNTVVQFESADTAGNTQRWYFGDGDSSTATNPSHDYGTGTGYFNVTHIVTDSLGCSSTDTAIVFINTLSIKEPGHDDVSIYPNPANNQIRIVGSQLITELKITDVLGRLVYKQTGIDRKESVIEVSNYLTGVYFIELTTNGKTITRRFIKQ